MAQQTTITLVDDLDGNEADEQVEFAVDGRTYEIDLSSGNAERLRESLAPYVAAGRRVTGRRSGAAAGSGAPSSSNGSSASERAANRAVREWAIGQGMKISERGRIPSSVLEAYQNAH
ncbi:histone-like nucleoid-structuring protein Lsr2 [Pseudonocardia nantongensis]|uniref:histone-like nucleoid-structuring protein Lsr2 n=1 Tax=Pseudonocardia nantongensis TaxID=1181885 RepID=UPI00397D3704